MKTSTIMFSIFPRTEPPPAFVEDVVSVFRQHEDEIATEVWGRTVGLAASTVVEEPGRWPR